MLKAGFIGFGRMGITHFSILNTHPSVKITAVCDQSSTMLNILKKYVDVKTYSDHKKMIAEEDLDFVVVSTPSDSHAEIIKFAVDRNLHTFTEKPLALTENEGQEILSCLKDKSVVNQVGYVNRFNEVFMEVKKLLDRGIIGDVKSFSSEMYGATILKDTKTNWRGKKNTGGGCMYELACHCIDLVLYFFGKPDRVMGSVMQSVYSSHVEDQVISTFVYDHGFSGTVMANWSDESYRTPANIVTIFGTKGKIIANKHAYKIYLRDKTPSNGFRNGWNTRYITDFAEPVRYYVRGNEFSRQLDYFVDCIEKNQTGNICGFSDAFMTDAVMAQITRDAAGELSGEMGTQPIARMVPKEMETNSFWKRFFAFWRRDYAS